jgi:hypothetical protein
MGRCLPILVVLSFTLLAQERRTAERRATVNLTTLAQAVPSGSSTQQTPRPSRLAEPRSIRTGGSPNLVPGRTSIGAPAAFTGFQALLDNYGPTPPDTGGAVGPNDVFTMLNSQVAVQSRTGSMRPGFPMALTQFWSALGPFEKIFDPRVLYDASAGRWIAAAATDPGAATASLLLAVTETGDPTGNWRQFQIPLGRSALWADYPVIGFNQRWITLSANLLDNPPIGAYDRTEIYVFEKSELYQKFNAAYTAFHDTHGQFTPATGLDGEPDIMYFAQSIADPAGGRIRVSRLSGAETPTFAAGLSVIATGTTWADTSTTDSNFAPQLGSYYKVDTGDSRLQNCVQRAGSIWCTHTVFLPANKPTRSAVQWFRWSPQRRGWYNWAAWTMRRLSTFTPIRRSR